MAKELLNNRQEVEAALSKGLEGDDLDRFSYNLESRCDYECETPCQAGKDKKLTMASCCALNMYARQVSGLTDKYDVE